MIVDKLGALRSSLIVLASGSSRRKEILNDILGLNVRVVPSTFAEDLDKAQFSPEDYVQENARIKALEVWQKLSAGVDATEQPALVIGGDTVVALGGRILGE